MRSPLAAAALLVGLVATVACSSAETPSPSGDDQAVVTTKAGDELESYLATVLASGQKTTASEEDTAGVVGRIDEAVKGDDLTTLTHVGGETLSAVGTDGIKVERSDGSTVLIGFRHFENAAKTTTMSIVRIEDSADASAARNYAERNVVTLDRSGNVAKVTSTLFAVDPGSRVVVAKNDVATGSDVAQEAQAEVATAALRILDTKSNAAGGNFGSPGLCHACKVAVGIVQIGNSPGVNTLVDALGGAVIAHHVFTTACIGVGVAIAGGELLADGAAEATTAGAATPAVAAAAPSQAAAAVGGYRGCKWIMAAISAWVAARTVLPNDEPGRIEWCNKLAVSLPDQSPWCVANAPDSCSLSKIPQSGDQQAQCLAVGRCLRDMSCKDGAKTCTQLFVASTPDAQAARDRCGKIASVACGPSIQSEADLAAACQAVLN